MILIFLIFFLNLFNSIVLYVLTFIYVLVTRDWNRTINNRNSSKTLELNLNWHPYFLFEKLTLELILLNFFLFQ